MKKPTTAKLNNILRSHWVAAQHYATCMTLTNEPVLIRLMRSLMEQRQKMAVALANITAGQKENKGKKNWLSSLQHLRLFLMLGTPKSYLCFCYEQEKWALQQYEEIIWNQDLTEEQFRQATCHQQSLKESLREIEKTYALLCTQPRNVALRA